MTMSEFAERVLRDEEPGALLSRLRVLCTKDLEELRDFSVKDQWIVWDASETEAIEAAG